MKKPIIIVLLLSLIAANPSISAQDHSTTSDNYLERHPIYDYQDQMLNSTDTIPGFLENQNKVKITGTIYQSDGTTPAKDVILYIEQAEEHGDFDLREDNEKRYVHNRGWVKTDANGHYTFYTYVPGNDRRYNQLQQLFPAIKEPSKAEYDIASFLFEEDPLLTKRCRKRMAKKGDPTRILDLNEIDGLMVAQKDIILPSAPESL
ncbi:MAG: hypothetical protein WA775_16085 [Psychroserpens sp.]|uniref:hypothetical protein n=1 Tax=Psychroserpens sp. TaxID=2020870 RepID=UPI003C70CD2D